MIYDQVRDKILEKTGKKHTCCSSCIEDKEQGFGDDIDDCCCCSGNDKHKKIYLDDVMIAINSVTLNWTISTAGGFRRRGSKWVIVRWKLGKELIDQDNNMLEFINKILI